MTGTQRGKSDARDLLDDLSAAQRERMRAEQQSQYPPDTEAPEQRSEMPERVLTDEDYA